jgi:TRAP-type C4-dicarboxylate transport system substrate-binding protein
MPRLRRFFIDWTIDNALAYGQYTRGSRGGASHFRFAAAAFPRGGRITIEEDQLIRRRPHLLAAAALTLAALGAQAQTQMKIAIPIPPSNPMVAEMWQPWAKRVSDASGGELNVQVVTGTSLANPVNVWERTVNGVTEMSFGIHGAVGIPFPKTYVTSLPFVVEDLAPASVALYRLYANGLIADEHKDVKVLGMVTSPVQGISSKKPVVKLEELKGMKIRAADRIVADIVTSLGGTPISVPAQEVYQAMSSGVVGGAVAGWVLVGTFKLYEQATEFVESSLGAPPGFIIMNLQAYDKLSPKAKAALDGNSGEVLSREFGAWFQGQADKSRDQVKAMKGQNVRQLSPQEAERWKKAVEPVIKGWEERTPNGDKVLAAYRAELQKLRK